MSILSKPYFHNEEAAYAKLESIVWPNGPVCPHCGATDRIYDLKGKTARPGLRKCGHCRKQFTVKVGTVFESSHVPLHKWLQATYLMCASKKGISAHQLHRTLEVTYKTAWFMEHRLREAMRSGDLTPFGSDGGAVEVDETFIGNDRSIKPKGEKKGRGYAGIAFGSYTGVLKAVDLRGVTQKAVLVLAAGGKQIECVVNTLAVSKLRDALGRRVAVSGRAHYEAGCGLPTRLDVMDVRILPNREDADLARWRGAFAIPAGASEEDAWG